MFMMLAFIGICWWAYSPKRRKTFEEAAKLPFADEPPAELEHKSAALDSQKQG